MPPAAEVVPDEVNPLDDGTPEETIEDDDNALTKGQPDGNWSLFDLLATILATVLGIVMVIGLLGKRRNDDEEEDEEQANSEAMAAEQANVKAMAAEAEGADAEEAEEEEDEATLKRHTIMRAIGVVIAIASIVLLLVTQDFTKPMTIFDVWSIVFAIMGIANIVLTILSRKKQKDSDDEDGEEQQTTEAAPATA